MLVLTRKLNEDIVIDDKITVRVVSIDRGKVRLAVIAPRDVPVDRAEVHARRQEFHDPTPQEIAA